MLSRFPLRFRRSAGLDAERATPRHARFFFVEGNQQDRPTNLAQWDPWRRDEAESGSPHRFS